MSQLAVIGLLAIISVTSYLLSLTLISIFLPQLIALFAILFIIFYRRHLPYIYPISALVCLLVFCTGALHSPFFFLLYFLLFILAFQFPPTTSLTVSLILIFLLSQSLNSFSSLLPVFALIFITPLVWFVSRQTQSQTQNRQLIALEETDFLLWLNLKFKTGITTIIDLSSQLLSSPTTPVQKDQLKKIKSSAKNLLNSADNLTSEINNHSDET